MLTSGTTVIQRLNQVGIPARPVCHDPVVIIHRQSSPPARLWDPGYRVSHELGWLGAWSVELIVQCSDCIHQDTSVDARRQERVLVAGACQLVTQHFEQLIIRDIHNPV